MENGIRLYSITYTTVDIRGERDTASGLVVVPVRTPSQVYPRLVYQHGTVNDRNDVPSRLRGGYELAEIFGGMGFVTLAPDFLGLGTSRGTHPYVHADSEAWASIDMMKATEQLLSELGIYVNDQFFITGYSQGGHAAMALHRAIERDYQGTYTVTASALLSGPYSISNVMYDLILGDQPYNFAAYLPHTLIGYNEVYQLYDDIVLEAFQTPYVQAIRNFQNEQVGLFSLNTTLLNLLTQLTGSRVVRNLLRPEFISLLESTEDNPVIEALQDNDVYDWAPEAPTRLFYCRADDQVPYLNSTRADSVMNQNGARDLLSANLNNNFDHGQCVEPAVINTIFFFLQYRSITTSTLQAEGVSQPIMFPNPAQVEIRFDQLERGSHVKVYDNMGRTVLNTIYQDSPISIAFLPAGFYLVQTDGKNGIHGFKLFKQ